ncbi:MAG: hypothetical protein QM723_04885 [Myxococcaceae bacterium]
MHALIVALSVMGASDVLSKTTMEGLTFSAPSGWKSTDGEGSKTWEDSTGDDNMHAQLEVSVWTVDPRTAAECVQQVQNKLEGDSVTKLPDGGVSPPAVHFDKQKVGGQPAIRSVVFDYVGQGEAAKVDKNKVSTVTYVGCNGTTRWLLTMTSPASKSPRFGALLKKIVDSVQYSGK